MKHLIVFPGGSSPFHEEYVATYDLLREEAAYRGIETTIVLYPGQVSKNGNTEGLLSPYSAVEKAVEILSQFENKNEAYRTLGISFGCFVSLAAATKLDNIKAWERLVIWGCIPHWLQWLGFGRGIRNEKLAKGTILIDSLMEYYNQLIPVENLITQVELPVTVGVGLEDKWVKREYLHYLQRLCDENPVTKHTFVYVQGAHTMLRSRTQIGKNMLISSSPNYCNEDY